MGPERRAVRTVADALGLELSPVQLERYAASLARAQERLVTFEASATPTGESVPDTLALAGAIDDLLPVARDACEKRPVEARATVETKPGVDPYNTFRLRCRLESIQEGSLDGLDIAIKDNVAIAGVELTCGSDTMTCTPRSDATVVSNLLDAGARIIGTTNMDEFALHPTGTTCAHGPIENPVAPGRMSGGSSAGAGAAVAAGIVAGAVGTDTGGSVRIPAAFCGVVGVKPTAGVVSRDGVATLAPSMDTVGPLATDVETAARMHVAMAEASTGDGTGDVDVGEWRIGVLEGPLRTATAGVESAVAGALDRLAALGAEVESTRIDALTRAGEIGQATLSQEFVASLMAAPRSDDGAHGLAGEKHPPGESTAVPPEERRLASAMRRAIETGEPSEHLLKTLLVGPGVNLASGGRWYVGAQNERRELRAAVDERLGTFDVLVLPTTPMIAPRVDSGVEVLELVRNTIPFNLTGHPAVSVPCGQVDGVPVGVQVVASRHADVTALQVAREIFTSYS